MSDAALERLQERFEADLSDEAAFEALEEAHFIHGRWEELVALYQRRLAADELAPERNPKARARLALRLGQVLEERCLRPDEARALYLEVSRLDPEYRPALVHLRGAHARREQWDLVLQVAELESALPMRPFEKAAFATEMGEIWLDRIGDGAQAATHFEQALEAKPDHPPALLGLARAREICGSRREAVRCYERAACVLQGPDRAPVFVALARLAALEGDPDAAAQLQQRALADDPRDDDALAGLQEDARRREQWERFDEFAERRFALAPSDVARLAIAHDAGRVALERRRDPRGSRRWLDRALALFEADPVLHLLLADTERLTGNREAVAAHLRRAAELAGEAAPVELLRECAALARASGDDDTALTDLRRALERSPDDPSLLAELGSLLEARGGREELLEICEQQAAAAPAGSTDRAASWVRAGRLHRERGDAAAAVERFERALEAQPHDADALDGLAEIAAHDGDWKPLRAALERALAAPELAGAREIELRSRLGELLLDHFDDVDAARACFDAALALDPDAASARQGLERIALEIGDEDALLEAFEREASVTSDRSRLAFLTRELVRLCEGRDEAERALRWAHERAAALPEDRSALEACARLEERLGRSDELAATRVRLDAVLEGSERAANRRRLAELRQAADDVEAAIETYRSALDADPEDLESLRALEDLLQQNGRTEELAEIRRQLLELLPPDERTPCRYALGVLLADELDDAEAALPVFQALAGDPDAPEDVWQRLETLLERSGRFEALAEQLRIRRERTDDDDPAAVDLDLRRADLLGQTLRRGAEAAALYREVLRHRPEEARALDGLEQALRAEGDVDGLLALLEERAAAERDPARRDSFELARATLLEQRGDAEEAAHRLTAVAEGGGPESHTAERRLEEILERLGRWSILRDRLAARAPEAPPEEAVELRLRLAGIERDRLRDPHNAALHLEAAGELDPGRPEVWQALALLYHEQGRAADLIRALEGELRAGPDAERAEALHTRAAALYLHELHDSSGAARHYEGLLRADPAHEEAADFLMRQLEQEGRLEDLARVLETRLEVLAGDELQARQEISLRLRLAALHAGPLENPEAGLSVLEPAADREEALLLVAEPLADLYQQTGRRLAFLSLAERAAGASKVPEERAGWSLRRADALRCGGDAEAAAEAYRRVLADRPDDGAARSALRRLYRELGDDEALGRLLESELARLNGPAEIPVRTELAELLAERLGQPEEALVHWRRVLQIDARQAAALERALDLAEALERDEEWLELAGLALARSHSPAERCRLLRRKARLLADSLSRPEEAEACLRQALAEGVDASTLRDELRTRLEARGDVAGVLECLEAEVDAAWAAEPERARRLCERAAAVAHEGLSPDAALPWLERWRRLEPDDAALLSRIASLHRAAGRETALLRTLEAELALEPEPTRRIELALEQAQLLETRFEAPGRAAACLEAARARVPDALEVLRPLERLYAARGGSRPRLAVLRSLVDRTEGPERLAYRRRTAAVARALGERRLASEQLWAALAEAPSTGVDRVELLGELSAVLGELGRPDLRARVAEQELDELDSTAPVFRERRRELHRLLARLYSRELGRSSRARHHLRVLVDSDLLGEEEGDAELLARAEDELLDSLRAAGAHVELEARLARRLARSQAEANAGEVPLWLELGRLRLEQLHRPAAAAEAFREALARQPDLEEALRGLRRACQWLGRPEEVAETLEREAALASDRSARERAALYRELGRVAWRELDSTPRASRAFAAALEADPRDLDSLRSLQELFESMEDFRGALDLYESESALLGDAEPERRQEICLHVGEIARDRLDDASRAERAYATAAAIRPLAPERSREWAELCAALGQPERFVEAFSPWLDAPGSPALAPDHLRLARVLRDLGRQDAALSRTERALALDSRCSEGFDLAAELYESSGRVEEAAQALDRAAGLLSGWSAAERRLRAAARVEDRDPEQAALFLQRAMADDATRPDAAARLAPLALALGRSAEAQHAAERAFDRLDALGSLADEERLATALAGAEAARTNQDLPAAARLLSEAVATAPDHPEALAAQGEVLFALDDWPGARRALETRLGLEPEDPDAARHATQLARCLEAAGETEAAGLRYREAVSRDASIDEAYEGLARILVGSGRSEEAVETLRGWANRTEQPELRASRLLQAAELELAREGGDPSTIEPLLAEASDADPASTAAWMHLAELCWAQERVDEALEAARWGLDTNPTGADRGRLALVCARALERRGERQEAAERYAEAARSDPSQAEAVLSAARLLRSQGEWRAAADCLRSFVESCPADCPTAVGPAWLQLGRLRAGPLEDVGGAVAAYRQALSAEPENEDAREALAELLVHCPERWEEAVDRHQELLERNPIRIGSLRALLRIARGRGMADATATGLALLSALGCATPEERDEAPTRPPLLPDVQRGFSARAWEMARQLALGAAEELGQALGTGTPSRALPRGESDPVARFRAAVLAAEGAVAAPALVPLSAADVGSAILLLARLADETGDVGGDGKLVNALSAAVSRRTRRRLRRILSDAPGSDAVSELAGIDWAAWRVELRALASCAVLASGESELRSAFVAWLPEDDADASVLPREADIRETVLAVPESRALLRGLTAAWVEALLRGRA